MPLPKTASFATNEYIQALGHLQSRLRSSIYVLEQSAESNVQHQVHNATDPRKPLAGNGTTRKRSSSDSVQTSYDINSPSWLERQHLSQPSGTAQSPITIPESPCPKRVRLSQGPGAQDRPILIIDSSGESSRDTTVDLEEQILQDPPQSPGTSSCSDRTLPSESAQATPRLSTETMISVQRYAGSPRSRYTQHSALPSSPSLGLRTPFEPDVVVQEGIDVPRSYSTADILRRSASYVPRSHRVSHDAQPHQSNNEDWDTEVVLDSRRGRGRGGPVQYLIKSPGLDLEWRHWNQVITGSRYSIMAFHRNHPHKPCPSVVSILAEYAIPNFSNGDSDERTTEAVLDSRRVRGRGGPVHYLVKSPGYDPDWRHWRQILPGSNEHVIAFHRNHPDKPCPSVVLTLTKYPAPTLMREEMTDDHYEAFTDDDSSDTDSSLSG